MNQLVQSQKSDFNFIQLKLTVILCFNLSENVKNENIKCLDTKAACCHPLCRKSEILFVIIITIWSALSSSVYFDTLANYLHHLFIDSTFPSHSPDSRGAWRTILYRMVTGYSKTFFYLINNKIRTKKLMLSFAKRYHKHRKALALSV